MFGEEEDPPQVAPDGNPEEPEFDKEARDYVNNATYWLKGTLDQLTGSTGGPYTLLGSFLAEPFSWSTNNQVVNILNQLEQDLVVLTANSTWLVSCNELPDGFLSDVVQLAAELTGRAAQAQPTDNSTTRATKAQANRICELASYWLITYSSTYWWDAQKEEEMLSFLNEQHFS